MPSHTSTYASFVHILQLFIRQSHPHIHTCTHTPIISTVTHTFSFVVLNWAYPFIHNLPVFTTTHAYQVHTSSPHSSHTHTPPHPNTPTPHTPLSTPPAPTPHTLSYHCGVILSYYDPGRGGWVLDSLVTPRSIWHQRRVASRWRRSWRRRGQTSRYTLGGGDWSIRRGVIIGCCSRSFLIYLWNRLSSCCVLL